MKKRLLIIGALLTSTLLFSDTYSRANDIVTDHDTDLQWQDTPYSSDDKNTYNSETTESNRARQWIHAKAYCDNLSLDGGGWRLPAITELDAIVDKSHTNPALDPIFNNALGLGTWSGTTYPDNTSQAWGMGFYVGDRHHCTKNNKAKLIMCVRKGSGTPPPSNKAPVAKAGSDQTVTEGSTVTLNGSASSDSDGTIDAYVWKENGTVLSRAESFDKSNFSVGTHTITLTVTDNDNATDSDTVVIKVNAAATNNPPVAKAGSDQTVIEGDTVTLDGSASSDSDGTIDAYVWKENGTVLSRAESFDKSNFSVGTHTITLTVTDNDSATGTDSITVTVTADEPDWFEETEIDGKTEYTIIGGETSVVLDSGIKDDFDVKANDDMIFFTAKSPSVIGSCQVKAYITMKNDGTVRAGYTHEGNGCSNDIDTFAPGTIVTVDNNGILRIDAPITSDLVLGGK